MTRLGPAWLERFQEGFSAALRMTLDRRSGTLCATPDQYPPEIVETSVPGAGLGGAERLAVYNRQYWFRLFRVMQGEFPLVAGLMGAWTFNGECAAFLSERPPTGHELWRAGDGFADFLIQQRGSRTMPLPGGSSLPGLAIEQAARIDDAFRTVFWTQEPDSGEIARVQDVVRAGGGASRLRASLRFAIVVEVWPLLALRRSVVAGETPSAPVVLPGRLAVPQRAAIHRGPGGARVLLLTDVQATLYRMLTEMSLADALSGLERDARIGGGAVLGDQVSAWMALSMRLGFWDGIDAC